MSPSRFEVVAGTSALVLVAPHGGRRNPLQRPWGSTPLRVNDVHTAAFTVELAARTGATALVNGCLDRNEADLNRVSAANAHAPDFLEALAAIVDATVARHGHATLLTVHGWNVGQPVVDLGLGCTPGADPFAVGTDAAVSPAFARGPLRSLISACGARGIGATVGARYPARARENLLQLFTPRYRDDARPLVARLAALAPRIDAVQLEMGLPLRFPGAWRSAFIEAIVAALAAPTGVIGAIAAVPVGAAIGSRCSVQSVGAEVSCLVRIDPTGGRLLLFLADGTLAVFTGEPAAWRAPDEAGSLVACFDHPDALSVRFRGPLLHFPDTSPFLDLEDGFARARLVDADVALQVSLPHRCHDGGAFGTISGVVTLDGERLAPAGPSFAELGHPSGARASLRAALRLADGRQLRIVVSPQEATGFLCDGPRHRVVATAALAGDIADGLDLEVALDDGERIAVRGRLFHELPVVRGHASTPQRLLFATCRLGDDPVPAGWLEIVQG